MAIKDILDNGVVIMENGSVSFHTPRPRPEPKESATAKRNMEVLSNYRAKLDQGKGLNYGESLQLQQMLLTIEEHIRKGATSISVQELTKGLRLHEPR